MSNGMVLALQRLSGREMLINTDTADEFISNLTQYGAVKPEEIAGMEVASRESLCLNYGFEDDRDTDTRKPFAYNDGLAIIPIHGSLINRFGSSWGFVTGYNFIRRQMNAALDDDDVKAIVFDVNSPGGEASGCFELAREILASRRVKPSMALVDALAASGGVALAGSATKMFAIPSARVGSIGVYRQHVSIKESLKMQGAKITFAVAGEHKLDGSPYEDLPDSVLKDWTEDANRTWDDFIALVSDGRDMTPEAVKETQARVYRADQALALGLIDGVWTTTDAISAFLAEVEDDNPSGAEEEEQMTTKTTEATSAPVDYDKIAGMIGSAVGTAMGNVMRSQNIAAHGKAKGQVALASKLAANAAITEADAIAMIDDASAAAKPAPKKPGTKVAAVDGDGEGDDDDDDDDDLDPEGEGDGEGEGGDDEEVDPAEEARTQRRGNKVRAPKSRDRVNHLSGAMSRTGGGSGVGGGQGEGGREKLTGDAAATATLLGDYAQHTGTVLAPRKVK
jgi:signal peptide peptidase SppA